MVGRGRAARDDRLRDLAVDLQHRRRRSVGAVHRQQQPRPGHEHQLRRLARPRYGSAEDAFYNNLWAQAAAQGITAFVSAGDSGASDCNAGGDSTGAGLAVSGLASSPYDVAVGGTEYADATGSYWGANSAGGSSAMSYIPEGAWNESADVSGGTGLWATGGGVSSIYTKPTWQVAPGVPADGMRDLPDVSLSAASHDGYLVYTGGYLYTVGGTSCSSPSFAGLMALIVEKTGSRQGNANPRFYQLGNAQYAAQGAAVFHDVTTGGNGVPGVTGYTSAPGYDLATGLGSVDAYALANNWAGGTPTPDFAIFASPGAGAVAATTATSFTVSTTALAGFSGAISLGASGLPAGVTATFNPAATSLPPAPAARR